MAPVWLALLSPLPADARVERKPVATAEMLVNGTAGPIAGWTSVTVYLSEPDFGLRHVLITLDERGRLLSGGDHVMFVRATTPDGLDATLTDHESIGGRFEEDGSFLGTCTLMTLETPAGSDESSVKSTEQRPPTAAEVAALRNI